MRRLDKIEIAEIHRMVENYLSRIGKKIDSGGLEQLMQIKVMKDQSLLYPVNIEKFEAILAQYVKRQRQ